MAENYNQQTCATNKQFFIKHQLSGKVINVVFMHNLFLFINKNFIFSTIILTLKVTLIQEGNNQTSLIVGIYCH